MQMASGEEHQTCILCSISGHHVVPVNVNTRTMDEVFHATHPFNKEDEIDDSNDDAVVEKENRRRNHQATLRRALEVHLNAGYRSSH